MRQAKIYGSRSLQGKKEGGRKEEGRKEIREQRKREREKKKQSSANLCILNTTCH
jgi:hypothetical protein